MNAKTVSKNEPTTQAPTSQPTTNETPLKRICAELGITPKAARRKLRKAWRTEGTSISHKLKDRWVGDELRRILAPTKQ